MQTILLPPTPQAVRQIMQAAKEHKAELRNKKPTPLAQLEALDRAGEMAKSWTDRRILAAYLKLETIQWAACSKDDKEEANDYRRGMLRLLRRYCGRYQAMGYKRELAYYLAMLQDRRKAGEIAKHINGVTANDLYLEEYEIILESVSTLRRKVA